MLPYRDETELNRSHAAQRLAITGLLLTSPGLNLTQLCLNVAVRDSTLTNHYYTSPSRYLANPNFAETLPHTTIPQHRHVAHRLTVTILHNNLPHRHETLLFHDATTRHIGRPSHGLISLCHYQAYLHYTITGR